MAEENAGATETGPEDTSEILGDAGKKALEAERRTAKAATRERDALATRLKEFEDRDKSELERAAERIEAAEKRATDLEARALRLEVASEAGLTAVQAKRLVGATREELKADAKELLETFRPTAVEEPQDVTASLDLGHRGAPPKQAKTSGDLFAAAVEGSFTR